MVPEPTPEETRSTFRGGALLVFLAMPVPLLGGAPFWPVSALHAAWVVTVLVIGELVGRRKLGVQHAGLASTAGVFVFLPAIIVASGATDSIFYLLFVCMPLLVASMAPHDRASVILSGVCGLAWTVGLELWTGGSFGRVLGWIIFEFLCSAIAVWATVLHSRSQAERLRAEAERLAAVTRLAERERQEARSERLTLIGQLAASIAHEVNNPLSFVTANVRYLGEVLAESTPSDDRLEVLQETNEGLERIGNTIRMLQVFVQPNGGPLSGFVSDAVTEASTLVASRLRRVVKPRTAIEEGLPAVALGQRRLVQLMVNLLLNAADAVEGSPTADVSITATREAKGLRLVVEDSGVEVRAERAGLGLSLCREHVEEVGGTLLVEPRLEGGSRVTVSLPAAAASGPSAPL